MCASRRMNGTSGASWFLPAMRSIVRRRRGTCHRAALRADPLAPPHHEGRSGPKLSIALQHEILRFDRHCPGEVANAVSPFSS